MTRLVLAQLAIFAVLAIVNSSAFCSTTSDHDLEPRLLQNSSSLVELVRQLREYVDNQTQIIERLAAQTGPPTGTVAAYAGSSSAPDGWAFCDGRLVERKILSDLFATIGTTFGRGDGVTTFNLPDFRGRFLLGGNSFNETGAIGGEESVTLSIYEMPKHNHAFSYEAGDAGTSIFTSVPTTFNFDAGTSVSTTSAGYGEPHNNMPPFTRIGWFIKT